MDFFEQVIERILKVESGIFNQVVIDIYAMNDNAPINEKESFFWNPNEIVDNVKDEAEMILISDFKSMVGLMDKAIIGSFDEGPVNDNARTLTDFCTEQECVVTNIMFQYKDIYKYAWKEPTRNPKPITDQQIMKNWRKIILKDDRVYRHLNVSVIIIW